MKILVLFVVLLAHFAANAKTEAPKILSIKGQLYYHETGKWSENIFDKDFHIWNAVIGEGSLKGNPTHQTLFVIETDAQELSRIVVRITKTVRKKTETVKDLRLNIDQSFPGKRTFIRVLVDDTVFGTYFVSAHVEDIMGKKLSDAKVATVDFAGGE